MRNLLIIFGATIIWGLILTGSGKSLEVKLTNTDNPVPIVYINNVTKTFGGTMKSKSVLRRKNLMADKHGDRFRNNTTLCTRLNPEDRRTPRGRAFREISPVVTVGGISKDASKYGRRAYDRGDPS